MSTEIRNKLSRMSTKTLQSKIDGNKFDEETQKVALEILTKRASGTEKEPEVTATEDTSTEVTTEVAEEGKKKKAPVAKKPVAEKKSASTKKAPVKKAAAPKKAEPKKNSPKKAAAPKKSVAKKVTSKKKAEKPVKEKADKKSAHYKVGDGVEFTPASNNKNLKGSKTLSGEVRNVHPIPGSPNDLWLCIKLKTGQLVHKRGSACTKK